MVYLKSVFIALLLIATTNIQAQNNQPDDLKELQKLYDQMSRQMQGQLQGLQAGQNNKAQPNPNNNEADAPSIEIDTTKITNLLNSLKSEGPNSLKGMLQGAQNTKEKMAPVVKKTYSLVSDDKIRGAYSNLNKDWSWKELLGWQIAAFILVYILRHWLNSKTKLWILKLVHTFWTGLLLFFLTSFVAPRIVYGPAFTELIIRAFQIVTGNGPTS